MDMRVSLSSKASAAMPRPEDVFLSWIFSLPDGADLPRAARGEIDRIDRAGDIGSDVSRLRALLEQASLGQTWQARRRSRRSRH